MDSYYVTYGEQPSIYLSKNMIPKGVAYKYFRSAEKSLLSLLEKNIVMFHDYTGENVLTNILARSISINRIDEAVAYIKGSYNPRTGYYGIGIVFKYAGECVYFSEGEWDKYDMYHIAGELAAVMKAVLYAVLLQLRKITIVYGYEGVKNLATGEWRANQPYTEEYQRIMFEAGNIMDIFLVKAEKNCGVLEYMMADKLAKNGCDVNENRIA